MKLIRICRAAFVINHVHEELAQSSWSEDTPARRAAMEEVVQMGIDAFGEGSHWIETSEAPDEGLA